MVFGGAEEFDWIKKLLWIYNLKKVEEKRKFLNNTTELNKMNLFVNRLMIFWSDDYDLKWWTFRVWQGVVLARIW